MSQAESSVEATASSPEDWSSVRDPNERRKIQNRVAQRKFREKVRLQREERERSAENEKRAGGAYSAPEPEDLEVGEASGLPWGGISFRHVVATGKAKEQSSRETSLYAAASRTGGSSSGPSSARSLRERQPSMDGMVVEVPAAYDPGVEYSVASAG